jgi:hypothetical protein
MAGRMTGWMGTSGRGWKKKSFKVESSSSEENSKKNNFFFFFFKNVAKTLANTLTGDVFSLLGSRKP